jgi:hypothetical protein
MSILCTNEISMVLLRVLWGIPTCLITCGWMPNRCGFGIPMEEEICGCMKSIGNQMICGKSRQVILKHAPYPALMEYSRPSGQIVGHLLSYSMQMRLLSLRLGILPCGQYIYGLGTSLQVFERQGEREVLCWLGTYQKCPIMDCPKQSVLPFGTWFTTTATRISSAAFKYRRPKGTFSYLVTVICGTVLPSQRCCQMITQNCM